MYKYLEYNTYQHVVIGGEKLLEVIYEVWIWKCFKYKKKTVECHNIATVI